MQGRKVIMSNFEIVVIVFLVIAFIGFKTGGSHRKMRREEAKEAARIAAINENQRQMKEIVLNDRRNELRESRNARLHSIRRKNALYLQNEGVLWTNEDEAMLDYDRKHYDEWKAVGMTPPSFVK